MKKIYIYFSVVLLALTACDNYLDVSSDSKYGEDYVFGSKDEINRVLTSVYATLMSSDAYGQTYFYDLALNSDVEFKTFSSNIRSTHGDDFECFDGNTKSNVLPRPCCNVWRHSFFNCSRIRAGVIDYSCHRPKCSIGYTN